MKRKWCSAILKQCIPQPVQWTSTRMPYTKIQRKQRKMMELLEKELSNYASIKDEQNRIMKKRVGEEQESTFDSLDSIIAQRVKTIHSNKNEHKIKEEMSSIDEKMSYLNNRVLKRIDIEKSWSSFEDIKRETPNKGRLVRVSLLGLPNTGKSTFMNRVVGTKISGESRKRCFTQNIIEGAKTFGNVQMVFFDTPGMVSREDDEKLYRSTKHLSQKAIQALANSDVTLVFFDGVHQLHRSANFIAIVKELKKRIPHHVFVAVVNKIDIVHPKTRIMALMDELEEIDVFSEYFSLSSKTTAGIEQLTNYLKTKANSQSEWEYGSQQSSKMTLPMLVSEIIREGVFDSVHDEIPYQLSVKPMGTIREMHRMGGDKEIIVPYQLILPTRRACNIVQHQIARISKYVSRALEKHYFPDRTVKCVFETKVRSVHD